jgi:ABC-2 type transport system permease protein
VKRLTIIRGLMAKDVTEMFRNRFVAAMTLLSIVAYAGIYYIMPRTVDETFDIAFHAPEQSSMSMFEKIIVGEEQEGIKLRSFESTGKLKKAVKAGDYDAGVVISDDFAQKFYENKKPRVVVYYPAETSKDVKKAVVLIMEESAFALTRQQSPVDFSVKVLGPDRAGEQVPPRKRVIPTFIVLMLFMEMWGIANLITEETEKKTLNAILITPARASDVIIAKGFVGTFLGFSEAALLAFLLQAINKSDALLVLGSLLLGAMMVTGIAFIIGSLAKDLLSMAGYSLLGILLLIVPAMAVLFPGAASSWVRAFPSYYLIEVVNQAVIYKESVANLWSNLGILLTFDLAVFWMGAVALRRRFQ